MYEKALDILKTIDNNGFKAYIVGGYVRDLYIGRKSSDIDICTNATPMDLTKMFSNLVILDDYGAVKLNYKGYVYDITTFRKDIKYNGSRKDVEVKYTDDIEEDILRRDFTINTLYMDKDGNIIDLLDVRKDIDNKIIKVIGDPKLKLKEDPLRILRAIRYATVLNFKLDKELQKQISEYRDLIKNLSYDRKKTELTRIFMSHNYEYGLSLIKNLKLDKSLEISHINDVKWCSDTLGVWAQIDFSEDYKFSKRERETIDKIRELIKIGNIDSYASYKYGNYLCSVAAEILDLDKKKVNEIYDNLPIHNKKEINISFDELCDMFNNFQKEEIKEILLELEKDIVYNKVQNKKEEIEEYLINKYRKE